MLALSGVSSVLLVTWLGAADVADIMALRIVAYACWLIGGPGLWTLLSSEALAEENQKLAELRGVRLKVPQFFALSAVRLLSKGMFWASLPGLARRRPRQHQLKHVRATCRSSCLHHRIPAESRCCPRADRSAEQPTLQDAGANHRRSIRPWSLPPQSHLVVPTQYSEPVHLDVRKTHRLGRLRLMTNVSPRDDGAHKSDSAETSSDNSGSAKTSTLSLRQARILSQTRAISLDFRPGIHALVTARKEYAQALLECLGGLRQPLGSPWNRGHVRLAGSDPFGSPQLRAQLGLTLPHEPALPAAPTLQAALDPILRFRLQADPLATASPGHLVFIKDMLEESPLAMTDEQLRRVALGLALSLRAPRALLLYHPLQHLSLEETSIVLERLRHYVESGVPIVCVTPTLADAQKLSPRIQEIGNMSSPAESEISYRICCSEPARLAELAADRPGIGHVLVPEEQPHCLLLELTNESSATLALTALLAEAPGVIFQVEKTSR